MTSLALRCVAVSLALSLVACSKQKTPATSGSSASAGATSPAAGWAPDTVLATYDGGKITAADLDAKIAPEILALRRESLDQFLSETLLKAEAGKRGITQEQLIKTEVDDKLPAPPEEQMKQMYEQAKGGGQLPPTATFEQVRPQIVQFMQRQEKQKRVQQFIGDLRKTANAKILFRVPVAAVGPARGPEEAKVTIVEFSDFQCPYCSRARDTVEKVMETYPGKVRLVFRHFPLSFHKDAVKAAEASLCADEQGKFWPYHDLLFAKQQELGVDGLKKHATAVGLDAAKFNACLDGAKFAEKVKEDQKAGEAIGVKGTPAFFINGQTLSGAVPFEDFKAKIDEELASN